MEKTFQFIAQATIHSSTDFIRCCSGVDELWPAAEMSQDVNACKTFVVMNSIKNMNQWFFFRTGMILFYFILKKTFAGIR